MDVWQELDTGLAIWKSPFFQVATWGTAEKTPIGIFPERAVIKAFKTADRLEKQAWAQKVAAGWTRVLTAIQVLNCSSPLLQVGIGKLSYAQEDESNAEKNW